MEQTVIVTGVSSFVGAHVTRYFAQNGLRVIGTISRPLDSYNGIKAERLALAQAAGVRFEQLDLTDQLAAATLIRHLKPTWWVSHAGWAQNYASQDYDLIRGNTVHLVAYDSIFSALRDVGARGLISTGSSMEYNAGVVECFESDLDWPNTPYGFSKLSKTIRLRQLSAQYDVPVRVARLFVPFGVLDAPERLIPSAGQALLQGSAIGVSSADNARDFIHVHDVCRAYLALLHDLKRPSLFEVFNVSGGRPVKLGEILRQFAALLGANPDLLHFGENPARPEEGAVQFGNNEKLRKLTGWKPEPWEKTLPQYARELRVQNRIQRPTLPAKPPLIRLSRSSIGTEAVNRVATTLRQGFLGMGTETDAFENELKAYLGGQRQVICVNTGTAALHLALQGCGIGPGDEVLVPTLTFVASFQAITAAGAAPIACDVRAEDGYIDLADAARRLTSHTRAIMPVHYAGSACGLAGVYEFARQHNLRVIEDAAHAFGGLIEGKKVGSFGDVACFSFDGIKNITCGEGGCVVTGDKEVAERIKDARLLGVEKDTEKRFADQRSWEFDVHTQGWRCHLSNLNATLGRAQLLRLESEFIPRRRALAARYRQLLGKIRGVQLFNFAWEEMVPHIFPVRIPPVHRDAVRAALTDANIQSGIHYKPNHLLSFYGGGKIHLPVAEELYKQLLTLPLHFELTDAEQSRVVDIVESALAGFGWSINASDFRF